MKTKKNKNTKFYISKDVTFWTAFLTIFSFVVFICFYFLTDKLSSPPSWYNVIKEVTLILFTILFTNLISNHFIETRSKNELYSKTIVEDVLNNPVFSESLSESVQRQMLSCLEEQVYFKNRHQMREMFSSIRNKLAEIQIAYYYSECSYDVSYFINQDENIIEKEITRTICIRSYQNSLTLENLLVVKWGGLCIPDNFRLNEIIVNHNQYLSEADWEIDDAQNDSHDIICGYTDSYKVTLKIPIQVFSDQDTTIQISYSTKTPLEDVLYSCRTNVPCKRFSVKCQLVDSPGYELLAAAYGFQDKSPRSIPHPPNINIVFTDWVFAEDGVTVVLVKTPSILPSQFSTQKSSKSAAQHLDKKPDVCV